MEQKKKAEEREMFKKLPFGKKVEHIFTYYWAVFIGVLVVAIITISVLNAAVFNPERPTFVRASLYGRYMTPNQILNISIYLHDYIDEPLQDTHRVNVDNFFTVYGQDLQMNMAQIQRFNAQILARELDLIVFTEEYLVHLLMWGNGDLFLDLNHIFNASELDILGDRVIHSHINYHSSIWEYLEDYYEKLPHVIRLQPGSTLAELKRYDGYLFVGIVRNTRRMNNVEVILRELVRQEILQG